ncbi:MAG TPA: four helix bundle protein [Kofleriaceae bacterium]|nr:four helix bundle protein [Kofleriaceae bacterium]
MRVLADRIGELDRDQARQLRRSSVSVVLNVAEADGSRGGTRRARYDNALGSARETLANLEAAEAIGYLGPMDAALRNRFDHIIGTLVRLHR